MSRGKRNRLPIRNTPFIQNVMNPLRSLEEKDSSLERVYSVEIVVYVTDKYPQKVGSHTASKHHIHDYEHPWEVEGLDGEHSIKIDVGVGILSTPNIEHHKGEGTPQKGEAKKRYRNRQSYSQHSAHAENEHVQKISFPSLISIRFETHSIF